MPPSPVAPYTPSIPHNYLTDIRHYKLLLAMGAGGCGRGL